LKNDVKICGRKQASEGGKYRMKENAQINMHRNRNKIEKGLEGETE
jgi:hypothetical protein